LSPALPGSRTRRPSPFRQAFVEPPLGGKRFSDDNGVRKPIAWQNNYTQLCYGLCKSHEALFDVVALLSGRPCRLIRNSIVFGRLRTSASRESRLCSWSATGRRDHTFTNSVRFHSLPPTSIAKTIPLLDSCSRPFPPRVIPARFIASIPPNLNQPHRQSSARGLVPSDLPAGPRILNIQSRSCDSRSYAQQQHVSKNQRNH